MSKAKARIIARIKPALMIALPLTAAVTLFSCEDNSTREAKRQIELFHQQDIEATLSDKADELAKLWDSDAVRIQPGGPPDVGKATIFANDKTWEAKSARPRTLCYKSEIQDLQITGDWAFEWGYFSYTDSSTPK